MSEGRMALPIQVRALTKRYGPVVALDRVDLDIESGEFLTLLGPSGSGKTTLLTVLAGFTRPDAGAVHFGDREVTLEAPHRRNVGMVFQNYALFPHLDVLHNVMYPLRVRRLTKREAAARARAALELVDLGDLGSRRTVELSGGQQQRVALARAIVFEPPILLMDEPLSALDKNLRERMQIELRRLHERLGLTTVYVTHDQREALTMSDRIAVVNRGRIEQVGDPRQVYERPVSRFVGDFIGESVVLPVALNGDGVSLGGQRLAVDRAPSGAGPHVLLLRPEKLRLAGPAEAGDVNLFEGRVSRSVYQGESVLLLVAIPEVGEVPVRMPTRADAHDGSIAAGDAVRLALHASDTLVLEGE
jgi:putative spermidine/putrescine transport system ATP-binding protein